MTRLNQSLVAAALMLTTSTAMAHTGHGEGGFTSGLLHPMLGLDHLLAMAAIGFWSVRQNTLMKNATPAFVLGGMVLGAGLAWGGLALPGVETGIGVSVLVAGILIASFARMSTSVGGTLVVAFMLFHGYAHGVEIPGSATVAAYLAGFATTTLAISLAGRALGALMLKADNRLSQGLGGSVAAAGALLTAA
ncbi:urease accessory protein [Halospina denitrificans]|uniref:Urease accessory protein n=1 Tax=Halospina denitrificans TaxID=332522 RepID=A0A4R7JHC3_9GAMM|nr:HupE/UreJ family protein [Halospina denitrificans]TDT37015.1 urease accessory protein [Halospina denitrificans]